MCAKNVIGGREYEPRHVRISREFVTRAILFRYIARSSRFTNLHVRVSAWSLWSIFNNIHK